MPIYAYRCADCGHAFDRLQKLSEPDPDTCPVCGAAAIRRQLTAPSFRLAGSGWYETDFKKDGDRKRNLVEGAEGKDAKPEAPAAGKDAVTGADQATQARPEHKPEKKPPAAQPEAKAASKSAAQPDGGS